MKGIIVFDISFEEKASTIVHLEVAEAYRDQGYGRILVYAAMIAAALHGYSNIELEFSRMAKEFYRKMGFIETSASFFELNIKALEGLAAFGQQIASTPQAFNVQDILNTNVKLIKSLSEIKKLRQDLVEKEITNPIMH